ncbi:MAG: OmpW family outer membrane protein [Acidobacteriota bacterium]|nr:OmpW family outer membrane protein [Acidobacteriota bacterium]
MPSKSKYSEGVIYGGNICLLISKYLAIEMSGLSFQSDVEEGPEALSAGKLSVIPISLSLQGRLPVNDFLTPYIEVGGSYFLNDFSLNDSIVSSWNNVGFDINEEVEKSIGLQVGMGLDLFISKSFIFNIDCKYFINNTNGSWELIDQVSNEKISGNLDGLDMSYIYIGFGLKYLFSF